MAQVSFAILMLFAGLALTTLPAVVLWRRVLHVRRRALASALIGELVGFLRIIETGNLEARLHEAGGKRRSRRATPGEPASRLPEPSIFEANANRLDLFEPSLARKIANAYTLLKGATGSLSAAASDAEQSEAASIQLREGLSLADDVLHRLRPLL